MEAQLRMTALKPWDPSLGVPASHQLLPPAPRVGCLLEASLLSHVPLMSP